MKKLIWKKETKNGVLVGNCDSAVYSIVETSRGYTAEYFNADSGYRDELVKNTSLESAGIACEDHAQARQ